eukprot:gene20998-27856_t
MSTTESSTRGSRFRQQGQSQNGWPLVFSIIFVGFFIGYFMGFAAKDSLFTDVDDIAEKVVPAAGRELQAKTLAPDGKLPGDTVHTVFTSSGDHYQNFQTRIMYGTYKLVQKMPGGERMTGFTRILHRTVPDLLMDEVPTFHVWDTLDPACDGWCKYPVVNRPNAIAQFFQAVTKNASMLKGAWILMAECDYVWMSPMKVPGDAYDPSFPAKQYLFDYIMPTHPDAAPHIQRLFGKDKNISLVPASGPAPVLMRWDDWNSIIPDYTAASARMELDEPMVKQLAWMREMYAWDVAVAMNPQVKIDTQKPPDSTLIVQPPFDLGMFNASLCHYTWGAIYHEKGKEIYRWEKRDYNELNFVVKPPQIKMPPAFKPGWRLEFDVELTVPRHNLVVLYLTQLNKGLATLKDLTYRVAELEKELAEWNSPEAKEARTKVVLPEKHERVIKYLGFSGIPIGSEDAVSKN